MSWASSNRPHYDQPYRLVPLTVKAILGVFLQLVPAEVTDLEVEAADLVTENRPTLAEGAVASVTETLVAGTEEVMLEVVVDSVTGAVALTVTEAALEAIEGMTSLILVSTSLPPARVITILLLPSRPSAPRLKRSKPPKI